MHRENEKKKIKLEVGVVRAQSPDPCLRWCKTYLVFSVFPRLGNSAPLPTLAGRHRSLPKERGGAESKIYRRPPCSSATRERCGRADIT